MSIMKYQEHRDEYEIIIGKNKIILKSWTIVKEQEVTSEMTY